MTKLVFMSLVILLHITSIIAMPRMQLISVRLSDTPATSLTSPLGPALAPTGTVHIRLISKHRDYGVAGGDVILGGFAFALVAAVVCYIRATRKNVNHQPDASLLVH